MQRVEALKPRLREGERKRLILQGASSLFFRQWEPWFIAKPVCVLPGAVGKVQSGLHDLRLG